MGDIADAILEGSMCQTCGEYLGEGDGFPRFCAGCRPRPEPKKRGAPEKFGSTKSAFVNSIGSKVVHRVNPKTRKSFCQFENNLARNNSLAFNGAPPLEYFDKREKHPFMKDCKNCASLAERVKP